jgi:hypothetical protein
VACLWSCARTSSGESAFDILRPHCCHPALSRVSAVSSHVTSVCPSLSLLLTTSLLTLHSGVRPVSLYVSGPARLPTHTCYPVPGPGSTRLALRAPPETATRGGTNTLMLRILTPCTATPALSSTLAQWQSSAALGVGRLGEGRPVAHLRCPARACLFAGVRLPAAVGLLRGTGFRIMHPHFPPCE